MVNVTVVIRDQPSVWAWLGPVLLFVGAMITLWISNYRADKREWNKWRRDTLVKLCADAVAAGQEVIAMCESVVSQTTLFRAQANLASASRAAARIGTYAEQLYLMNLDYLADLCVEMGTTAEAIILPTNNFRTSKMVAARREEQELKAYYETHPAWFAEDPSSTEMSPAMRQNIEDTREIRQRIHEQTLAQPEVRYAEARSDLEAIRQRFLQRGRYELKSAS